MLEATNCLRSRKNAFEYGIKRRIFFNKKIMGKEEVRRFLENLGFVAGAQVSLVSKIGGNVIVQVKESRVAISKEMAQKIIV